MALHVINKKYKVYKGEKWAESSFRKELSKQLLDGFGRGPFTQEQITDIVRLSLEYYSNQFIALCQKQTEFYFYQSVLMFHEDAVELVLDDHEINSNVVTMKYLAMYRRILKWIMEAGCEVEMKIIDIKPGARQEVERWLDQLLFLGDMIMTCVTLYAEQGMIEDVGELYFDDNDLYVFSRRHHYNMIFNHIIHESGNQYEKQVYDEEGIEDLQNAIEKHLGINYESQGHVIASIKEQLGDFPQGFNWDALPENLERLFGIPYSDGERFFRGLTLDKHNKLNLIDVACKPSNLNRMLYKPIVIWNVNGKDWAMLGPNTYSEAIIQYATNAIPWGKAPAEWMAVIGFKEYVHSKEDLHDKWLDDAVEEILRSSNVLYTRNLKKLSSKGGPINIDVKGLGEIDFLIVANEVKKIYISDCKHLVTRYDAASQKNDFNAFTKSSKKTKSYNETMTNKVAWFKQNINIVTEHFGLKQKSLSDYSVEGIFILNTPTIYMYNSQFRIFVVDQISSVLNGTFEDQTFIHYERADDHTELLKVNYPYFRKPGYLKIDPFENTDDF
ncbi:MAG: hypothetical protein EOO46_04195 [Flavobacterium sp.]|nr:MAG: hypothetical protein EOO46_04195 [Flavobacterium sp.]